MAPGDDRPEEQRTWAQLEVDRFCSHIRELEADRDRLAAENARLREMAEDVVYIHRQYENAPSDVYVIAMETAIDELRAALGEEG